MCDMVTCCDVTKSPKAGLLTKHFRSSVFCTSRGSLTFLTIKIFYVYKKRYIILTESKKVSFNRFVYLCLNETKKGMSQTRRAHIPLVSA